MTIKLKAIALIIYGHPRKRNVHSSKSYKKLKVMGIFVWYQFSK
jgi:hypothetical protein